MAYHNRMMTPNQSSGCQPCGVQRRQDMSMGRMNDRRSSAACPRPAGNVSCRNQVNENKETEKECECKKEKKSCIDEMPLAMAYVPFQGWSELYDLEKGFQRGTIFPCLDKPFMGGGCHEKR